MKEAVPHPLREVDADFNNLAEKIAKPFISMMDTSPMKALEGVPDVGEIRFAATSPDLVAAQAYSGGYRMSTPDVRRGLLASEHPSYDTKIARAPETASETFGTGIPSYIFARDTALPRIAEQMNIMQKNVAKLVKLQGGTPSTKAQSYFSSAKFRENAYEATFNKNAKGTTPTKVEEKKEGGLGGIVGLVASLFDFDELDWKSSFITCENLKLSGFSDWVLPYPNELKLMYDKLFKNSRALPPINLVSKSVINRL